MSNKPKYRIGLLLFLVVISGWLASVRVYPLLTDSALRKVDNASLALFAQKIAATDHIIAIEQIPPSHRLISLTLTGENARRVVQAVSSGKADRASYSNVWSVKATFFEGTNALGEIMTDGELFLAEGRQYKDGSYKEGGIRGSGVLRDLVVKPLGEAVQEAEMKEIETK